jgi:alpha,alpha-trehalose phosphorylase
VIDHPSFAIEPWAIRETHLDLDVLAQTESVFAVSNGHIGWRGNLDEGEPHGVPGTYLNGVFEYRPLPYAEAGYGYPGSGQTVINITNGKLIRLLVDDEPFDVRYGTLEQHERVLDFRAGTLERWVRWTSPAGRTVKVHSTRLVSFGERAIAALLYEVEAVDPVSVVLQSELVANESLPDLGSDPRTSAALASPLVADENTAHRQGVVMTHHTRVSALRVAAAMDHHIEGPDDTQVDIEAGADVSRVVVATHLEAG